MMSFQKTSQLDGSFIYGRTVDLYGITELLYSEDGTDVNSTVVSVVADRGTGRTTMLHLLYNELCYDFDITKYICMPENFDEKGIMRLVIESLTGICCDITDLEVLKETVKEELIDQRLLLLLDDFESKSQNCWDHLLGLLQICNEKSAVVVTATREAVAKVKGPMHFYYMNNLSKEWCWMMLKQGVIFGQNPDAEAKLTGIGKCIVAKCRNVTLCIKVLSGLLRESITYDWWRSVLNNSFWETKDMEVDILPALRVCYEYLPFHLKQCFKFCSLFPKEYIFSKQYLVRMWLSQGFIEPGDGRELEDIGLEYFDQLVSRSFLQPPFIYEMKEDKFVMPGLIHDLAIQFSKDECFQFEGCVQRAPENTCHLSLVSQDFESVSLSQLITRTQNLQTFLVIKKSTFQDQSFSSSSSSSSSSSLLNIVALKDLFLEFRSLITLNLNNTDMEELPESFMSLINLRYLGLSRTKIKRIPMEISNLIHLQTLDAKDCHYLEELPRTIEALTNLRYLDVSREEECVAMPRGIGKLTNLRSLATFNVGLDPLLHCGIEELKDMDYLKGCLQISGLVNVRSTIDACEADMRSKKHIETLCLHWGDEKAFFGELAEIAEEVLQSLHPTSNLKEMIIRDYPGTRFPMWLEFAPFSLLASIIFDHCYSCETLPCLGGLPSLRLLSIHKMHSVQTMNLCSSEPIPNSISYPSLEQLTIGEMYELVKWVEIRNGDFPALRSLCISKCPLLRNVPKFPALFELSIYHCSQFLEVIDLPYLQTLRIVGLQNMKYIEVPKYIVGLKKLEISHCPELLSVEALSLLNSLEMIIVLNCPQLDFNSIVDGRYFTIETRGNTSVWSRKIKLASNDAVDCVNYGLSDEAQEHPTVSKKRKGRDVLSSLSGIFAEGHKKIKELESKMSKQDQGLVENDVQWLIETVQNSISNLMEERSVVKSAIMDSNSPLISLSESSSSVGFLSELASGSCTPQDVHIEKMENLKDSRRKTIPRWSCEVSLSDRNSVLDDGYSWRKYGQKDILGCKYPRGYYRCAHRNTQGCIATKQVHQSDENPDIFNIIYHGTHTCIMRLDSLNTLDTLPKPAPIKIQADPIRADRNQTRPDLEWMKSMQPEFDLT